MRGRVSLIVLAGSLLSGCVPPPEAAEILVNTAPPGAACTVSRLGQAITATGPTPAIAIVPPTEAPLTVACRRNGFADAAVTLPALAAEPSFARAVYHVPPYTYQRRIDIALVPARP